MSPEHTLLLIDGQRYNRFRTGLRISESLLLRRRPRRDSPGWLLALYGSDCRRRRHQRDHARRREKAFTAPRPRCSVQTTAALPSSGWKQAERSSALRGSLRREQGRGDYESDSTTEGPKRRWTRGGEDYALLSGDVRADWRVSPTLRSTASFTYADADRGSPGVVTDPSSNGRGRLWDRLEYLRGGIDWDAAGGLSLRVNGSAHYGLEHYDDPGNS